MVNVKLSSPLFVRAMTGDAWPASRRAGRTRTCRTGSSRTWRPGVQVLAGFTPEPNDGSTGDFFAYISGTSMATPHVSGIAALLLEAHPDWTPAIVKSALMTTASRRTVKEDGVTKADPFDHGSGRIMPNRAIDPGLAYDAGLLDYLAGACGTDSPLTSPDDCDTLVGLGFSTDPSDINLPSIGINGVVGLQVVHRTVTNVSDAEATYTATVVHPLGFRVTVDPESLTVAAGATASFDVTVRNLTAPAGDWRFGSLTWGDGVHEVQSDRGECADRAGADQISGTAPTVSRHSTGPGFQRHVHAGRRGLVEPFLTGSRSRMTRTTHSVRLQGRRALIHLLEAREGATALRSAERAYMDHSGDDLGLYVFYCPALPAGGCGSPPLRMGRCGYGAAERPSADDPYAVFVQLRDGGRPVASGVFFDWTVRRDGEPDGRPGLGRCQHQRYHHGHSHVNWTGDWPAEKWFGAVTHSNDDGVQGVTYVSVDNDEGAGYCDVVDCGP
jgi:hypothetical protein